LQGQRRKEKFAILERQAKSGSSASAESSTSPESSDQGIDADAGPSRMGVSLPDFMGESGYIEAPSTVDMANLDISFNSFIEPQQHVGNIGFTENFIPELSQPSYELYQPEPMLSMDASLDVPMLKTLKVAAMLAQQLGCERTLWDPTTRWTITTPHIAGLPENMQPTPAQMSIPHHPLFDILPWPQLRTKLICIFALPESQRPENARDSMALLNVAYDIEDATDGFRVNGEGMEGDDWEIGEAFFRNWSWALDRNIIETSNAWRQARGQSRLSIRAA
jgi:hypothetical protein